MKVYLFLQSRKYWVGGTASVVEKDDCLVVHARLSHQVPGEDVEDGVSFQFDPEVKVLAKPCSGDVVALFLK